MLQRGIWFAGDVPTGRMVELAQRAEQACETRPAELVREEGLEPSRPFGHRNLNPARLPIPPLARGGGDDSRRGQGVSTWFPPRPRGRPADPGLTPAWSRPR